MQAGKLQQPTCRVCRVPFQQGNHCESDLEEGEEYFFVLVTPTDPNSFVSVSDNKRVVAHSRGASVQPCAVPSPCIQPGPEISFETFCKLSLSNHPLICCMLTHGFAGLESRLDKLNLLDIDTSRLYRAGNSKNLRAFIGIMKHESSHPEELKMRRKVHWNS